MKMHNNQNYLVVGGDGLIGSYLYSYLRQKQKNVVATTRRPELVIENRIYFDLSLNEKSYLNNYRYAFLCAGITNMTICESDPENTYRINVDATLKLARQLLDTGCRIIYISSNTVFDGKVENPDEDTLYCFSTEYGRQKADVERELLSWGAGAVIVRITKVVSLSMPIFSAIIQNFKMGNPCNVYNDLFFCPMTSDYLCEALDKTMTSGFDGIFHLSGAESFSYADFASRVADYIGADPNLVDSSSAKGVFFKPLYAGLGMTRTKQLLNIFPQPTQELISKLISNEE